MSRLLLFFILFLLTPFFVNHLSAQTDLQIPSTNIPPVIDGIMDAVWETTGNGFSLEKYLAGSPVSASDFSIAFKTLWDTENLYILVEVTDDVKINDSGEVWQDDAVEIYIDINNDKQTSYGPDDFQYTFRWNDPEIHSNERSTSGIQFVISGTSSGYLLEVRFPWTTLGLDKAEPGVLLGFDVHTHDDDNGGERDTKKSWFATQDQSWNNPSLFATAILTGELVILYRADKPKISVGHGYYTQSFDVTISSVIEGMDIYYTLDGSHPATSTSARIAQSPVVVHIDPASVVGRGRTPGVVLRACAKKEGYDFSFPETRTYLFIDEVKSQTSYPGHDWPSGNYVNDQEIDLLIDPQITNDARYTHLIDDALFEVPSISIATDNSNLFDPAKGIYVNAWVAHGELWERPASIELINPDESKGFQIDAGIRMRGGWSRHGYFRKHAFRFFFRSMYGEGKLEYPLFENEGVKKFDKVDLRCPQNYSWSKGGEEAPYCTFNRDIFSRDVQREMGQPYTRSRYYHLYLNGLYWGLFQTQERSEARYAESYFGGNSDDYDVVKKGESSLEATDGNLDAWREVWDILQQGFDNNENYFKLQGMTPFGKRNPSLKVLVDIDNLIDYMNIIFYTGNFDAPTSGFGRNKTINNFFAIYNRNDKNQGFRFFAHDNEHSLLVDPINAGAGGAGVNQNRVNIGRLTNNFRMEVWGFDVFHPQWLHFKLSDNPEYRQRFADRSYNYYHNNGILTPARTAALFLNRTLEYDTAIIAESARWGDVNRWIRYTRDDHWKPMVDRTMNEFFPVRTQIVINQLKEEGLLSSIDQPVVRFKGAVFTEDELKTEPGQSIQIVNQNSSGFIRFTADGTDPRALGGNIAASAINGGNQANIDLLQTTILKARIYNNGYWSSLLTLKVIIHQETDGIMVTEIHYHPLDENGKSGNDYEFIELKNTASEPRNLTASMFTDGITYTFNNETILNPGEFIVLASTAFTFNERYGFQPYGEYSGQLNNGGERITLVSATGDTLFSIDYKDNEPWPTAPDGLGFSLVPATSGPFTDWNDGTNWRASSAIGGSPGADDPGSTILKVLINEILSNSAPPAVDRIELYNPNNTPVDISGWFLSDKRNEPKKWAIPNGTVMPANGYLTFNEGHYTGNVLNYSPNEFGASFALSSHGEEVYIFSGDGTNLTGYEHGENFGEIEEGVSFGRHTTSTGKNHFVAQASQTFNAVNSYPRVGPIVINQIMYNPEPGQFEYIELINTDSDPVALYDPASMIPWKMEGVNFNFPPETELIPGESVYLVESSVAPDDFRFMKSMGSNVKIFNYPGKLRNEGEEITLWKAAPQYLDSNRVKSPYIRIDRVDYNDKNPWPDADGNGNVLLRNGLELYGNDPANWIASPPGISVTSGTLANGIQGVPYTWTLMASGGMPAYTWSIVSGSLPAGISLNPVTGVLTGTATITGNYSFTVKVEDQLNSAVDKQLSLTIVQNTNPIALNDSSATLMGYSVSCDVLNNDTDQDGDRFNWQISIVTGPVHGRVDVNSDGSLTYFPDPGFSGTDKITYRATDLFGFSEADWLIDVNEPALAGETEMRITQSSDDAEENIITHQFWPASSDLELVFDANPGGDQMVGLRFVNVQVPVGAIITEAYIQFQTDEVTTGTTSLTISGEKAVNPVTFSAANLISIRQQTSSQTAWIPEPWNLEGEQSEKQRTPDLSAIVREIINQQGWQQGNAMAFIINGNGTRTAEAYDGDASGAPLLHIKYTVPYGEASTPVPIAMANQPVSRGNTVWLDGSQSYSSDGRELNYRWLLVSKPAGSNAVLSNSFIVNPTFTADLFGVYEVTLQVDNTVNTSELFTLTIPVINQRPVAHAGTDQNRFVGATVRLNGSSSSDGDGDPLTYAWTITQKPTGSQATLSNPNIVNPTFVADLEGVYQVSLTTHDGYESSEPDWITITVTTNQPPTAHAGDDQTVVAGSSASLNGNGSSDPEEATLKYTWILVSKPTGSMATLSNSGNSKPTLHTDIAGTYVVELTVSDGINNSVPDQVIITSVQNRQPVSQAGSNQTVNAGDRVTLNGSNSYDPDGTTLSYYWSFVTRPTGSKANISGSSTTQPTFTPDVSGLYTIRLRVSDGTYTDTDDVQITALRTNAAPAFTLLRTLTAYPNPFQEQVTVDYFTDDLQRVTFSLYTVTGTKICEDDYESSGHNRQTLDFSGQNLLNGMYFLVVATEQGAPVVIKLNCVKNK